MDDQGQEVEVMVRAERVGLSLEGTWSVMVKPSICCLWAPCGRSRKEAGLRSVGLE